MKASSFLVVFFFLPEAQNDFRILKFVHQNATFYEYCIKYKMKLRSGWRGENFQHFDGVRWPLPLQWPRKKTSIIHEIPTTR